MPTFGPLTVIPTTPTSPTDALAAEYGVFDLVAPGADITITSDSIDETTIIDADPEQILLGETITSNMSSVAPETINVNYAMNFIQAPYATGDGTSTPTWYSLIKADVDGNYKFGGCSLISTTITGIYIDPDAPVTMVGIDPANLYGHVNHPESMRDPILQGANVPTTTSISGGPPRTKYAYYDPWDYHFREKSSLNKKHGFDSFRGGSTLSGMEKSVTNSYLTEEISNVAAQLAIGFQERQNVRKIAQRPDYRRNYELISDSEQKESTSLVQQIVKTSLPSADEAETMDSEAPAPDETGLSDSIVDSEFREETRPEPGEPLPPLGTPGAY